MRFNIWHYIFNIKCGHTFKIILRERCTDVRKNSFLNITKVIGPEKVLTSLANNSKSIKDIKK